MSGSDEQPEQTPPVLWTADQVCAALGCRRSWLYDQVEARRLPVVRLGRQLRFRPADITAYLDAHTEPAYDPPPWSPGPPRPLQRRRRRHGPAADHLPT